jgi:hypothetical protein
MHQASTSRAESVRYPVPGEHGAARGGVLRGNAPGPVPDRARRAQIHSWMASEAAQPYRTEVAARHADAIAVSLASALARLVPALARVAAALKSADLARAFGYARLNDYARERLGRSGRWVADLARLHDHLERLPALRAAVTGQDGGPPLHATAAMAVGSVAMDSSVDAWIALARRLTVEGLLGAIRRGEGPDAGDSQRDPKPGSSENGTAAGPGDNADSGEADRSGGSHTVLGISAPIQPDAAPSELRLPVPPALRVAFRETLDLYRAVDGSEASVCSFVEALVAEWFTQPHDDDGDLDEEADTSVLRHAEERDRTETALEMAADGWKHLSTSGEGASPGWAMRLAGASLARLERLEQRAGEGDARTLDAQMRALLALHNELELRVGEVLHEMSGLGSWACLGFADAGHYAERRLGISRTAAEDRVWVSRAVRPYALVRMAYERGELRWEATRHILRALGGQSAAEAVQRAWIERGRTATVKRLGDEVKALQREAVLSQPSEGPSGGPGASAEGSADGSADGSTERGAEGGAKGGAEVSAEVGADGVAEGGVGPHCETESRPPMTDAAWQASLRREPGSTLAMMARLGGVLERQAESQTSPRHMNDGTMRLRLPALLAQDLLQGMRERRSRLRRVVREAREHDGEPDATAPASLTLTRIFSTRGWRTPIWVGLLALLEDFVETWDRNLGARMSRSRREIFARSGYRCAAPGCTSRCHLQEHHVEFRSRGGSHELTNRVALCAFHHLRGIHERLAACRGRAPLELLWRLGRVDLAEEFVNELRV